MVERFGAQAVLGRVLGAKEINRMYYCETLLRAYQERGRSDNWAAWAEKNKAKSALLNEAMKAAKNG